MTRHWSTRHLALLASGSLAFAIGCGGGDEDGGVDAGTVDTGSTINFDAGFPDSGVRDTGPFDSGPRPDGGHYCAPGNEVQVDGQGVAVDPLSEPPTASNGGPAILSCIDQPPGDPEFISDYCIVECLEFFGTTPSEAQVGELEFTVFPSEVNGQVVDPTFDPITLAERSPTRVLPVGSRVVEVPAQSCSSGWQLEMGFLNLGTESLSSDTSYTVRVRSSSTTPSWPSLYLQRFIRHFDEVPSVSACGSDEQRIPSRAFVFPIVSSALISEAVASAGTVPGSADLFDGRGTGYGMVETRDCAAGPGVRMVGASAGFRPAPIDDNYLAAGYTLSTRRTTSVTGIYMAIGFTGTASTSTVGVPVRAAVGVSTDGTCTEEYGGINADIYPDSVTYLRANRTTVIHGR